MLREQLLKKVRLIEVTTRRVMNDVLSGRYRSHFKGQGVQFSEHRQYVPGDDVRHIDWKVSARTRDPLIKKFEEERELSVLLIVDVSASGSFGSTNTCKAEVAAEIAGMLAHAAVRTGDKVGVLFFAGEVERIIPLRKGRAHIQRIIRDVLSYEATTRGTNLAAALDSAGRVLKHSGVVFILSDFISADFSIPLRRLARKHDVVAIHIADRREAEVMPSGQFSMLNPETGAEVFVDTDSYLFKEWFADWVREREQGLSDIFRKARVEALKILTQEDHGDAIVRYFQARARFGRGIVSKKTEMIRSAGSALLLVLLVGFGSGLDLSRAATESPGAGVEAQASPNPAADLLSVLPLVDVDWLRKPEAPLQVGDALTLRLSGFLFEEGMTLAPVEGGPAWIDQGFVIPDPVLRLMGGEEAHAQVDIGILREGSLSLEPMKVVNAAGVAVARTSPWQLGQIAGVLKPAERSEGSQPSPAPARGPVGLGLPAWVYGLALLLAGLLIGVLGYFSWTRWKKWKASRSHPRPVVELPPGPEDIEAIEAFGRFRQKDWQEVGKRRLLYFGISDTVKRYAARRWEFDAQESTTDEFLRGLERSASESLREIEEMSEIFEKLDRVKFADHQPEDGESLELIARLERFVRATRRPTPPAGNADEAIPSSATRGGAHAT